MIAARNSSGAVVSRPAHDPVGTALDGGLGLCVKLAGTVLAEVTASRVWLDDRPGMFWSFTAPTQAALNGAAFSLSEAARRSSS